MNRPPTNASTACIREDSVLLLCRSTTEPAYPGLWELPGGRIQPGETPAQAAAREFSEECGSRVDLLGVAGQFSWEASGQTKTEVVFIGAMVDSVRLSPEHSAYAWVSVNDLQSERYKVSEEVKGICFSLLRRSNEI